MVIDHIMKNEDMLKDEICMSNMKKKWKLNQVEITMLPLLLLLLLQIYLMTPEVTNQDFGNSNDKTCKRRRELASEDVIILQLLEWNSCRSEKLMF